MGNLVRIYKTRGNSSKKNTEFSSETRLWQVQMYTPRLGRWSAEHERNTEEQVAGQHEIEDSSLSEPERNQRTLVPGNP
jgi:hypothetical protein